MGGVRGMGPVVIGRVCLFEVEEGLHTPERDPGLNKPVDDPRISIEGAKQYAEERKTCEHLSEQQQTHN